MKSSQIHHAFGKAVYEQLQKDMPAGTRFEEKANEDLFVPFGDFFVKTANNLYDTQQFFEIQTIMLNQLGHYIKPKESESQTNSPEMIALQRKAGSAFDTSTLSKKEKKDLDRNTHAFITQQKIDGVKKGDNFLELLMRDSLPIGNFMTLETLAIDLALGALCRLQYALYHEQQIANVFHQKHNVPKTKAQVCDALTPIYIRTLELIDSACAQQAKDIPDPIQKIQFISFNLMILDAKFLRQPAIQIKKPDTTTILKSFTIPLQPVLDDVPASLERKDTVVEKEVEPDLQEFLNTIFGKKYIAHFTKNNKWTYCERSNESNTLTETYVRLDPKEKKPNTGYEDKGIAKLKSWIEQNDPEIKAEAHRCRQDSNIYKGKTYELRLVDVPALKEKAKQWRAAQTATTQQPVTVPTASLMSLQAHKKKKNHKSRVNTLRSDQDGSQVRAGANSRSGR